MAERRGGRVSVGITEDKIAPVLDPPLRLYITRQRSGETLFSVDDGDGTSRTTACRRPGTDSARWVPTRWSRMVAGRLEVQTDTCIMPITRLPNFTGACSAPCDAFSAFGFFRFGGPHREYRALKQHTTSRTVSSLDASASPSA